MDGRSGTRGREPAHAFRSWQELFAELADRLSAIVDHVKTRFWEIAEEKPVGDDGRATESGKADDKRTPSVVTDEYPNRSKSKDLYH
jgi:hypothetical protein